MIYLVLAPTLLWVIYHCLSGKLLSLISERQSLYLATITVIALIVIFAFVYPKANTHVNGHGSDADDALNLAANELLRGRYPFYVETYLHNPIGIFPGALLLALPFILFGNSALQNLFWLAAFFFAASRSVSSWRLGLLLLWALLLFSPVVMQQVVTGTDDLANSIYVLLFMLLLAKWGGQPGCCGLEEGPRCLAPWDWLVIARQFCPGAASTLFRVNSSGQLVSRREVSRYHLRGLCGDNPSFLALRSCGLCSLP